MIEYCNVFLINLCFITFHVIKHKLIGYWWLDYWSRTHEVGFFRDLLLSDHLGGVNGPSAGVRGQRHRTERALVQQRRYPEIRRSGRGPRQRRLPVTVVRVVPAELPFPVGPELGETARRRLIVRRRRRVPRHRRPCDCPRRTSATRPEPTVIAAASLPPFGQHAAHRACPRSTGQYSRVKNRLKIMIFACNERAPSPPPRVSGGYPGQ